MALGRVATAFRVGPPPLELHDVTTETACVREPERDRLLGFEMIPGERAVSCERGDVIVHHCDLWHSAARAAEDAPGGIRRHLRGSWNAGRRPEPGEELEAVNKNAAR